MLQGPIEIVKEAYMDCVKEMKALEKFKKSNEVRTQDEIRSSMLSNHEAARETANCSGKAKIEK